MCVCAFSLVALPSCHLHTPFSPLPAKDDRATFTRLMQDLADLIASYPGLAAGSHFVLVPGPNDPGASSALPQTRVRHRRVECVEVAAGTWLTSLVCVYVCMWLHQIPKIFTKAMEEHVSTVTFTTNPCR